MTTAELKNKIEMLKTISELKKEVERLLKENKQLKLKYIETLEDFKRTLDELEDRDSPFS